MTQIGTLDCEAVHLVYYWLLLLSQKNIIASLLTFAGYIHNHKILPENIFGLILKNKWPPGTFIRLKERIFFGPLEQRVL